MIKLIFDIVGNKISFFLKTVLFFFSSLADLLSISMLPIILSHVMNQSTDMSSFTYLNNFFINLNLQTALIIFLTVYLIKFFLIFLSNYIVFSYAYDIQNKILHKLYFNTILNRSSKDNSYFQNLIKITESFTKGFLICLFHFLNEILAIIGILIFLFIWNFSLTFISTIIIFIFFIIYQTIFKNFVISLGKRNVNLSKILFTYINYSTNGFREILIYKKTKHFFNFISQKLIEFKRINIFFDLINLTPRVSIELLFIISMSLLYISFDEKDDLIINSGIYGFAFIKIAPSIIKVLNLLNSIRHSYYTAGIIRSELFKNNNSDIDSNYDLNFNYFEIKDLTFEYNSNKNFKYPDLRVNKGDKILVKGRSGVGKSTLLDLIAGIYKPTNGRIIFYDSSDNIILNPKIAYCPQNPLIIESNFSLNMNLIFDVEKSIKFENIFDIPDNLYHSNKINSPSAGEIKRLGLSRLYFSKSEILIIDEPLANLDQTSQNLVINKLFKNNQKTIISVSHNNEIDYLFDKIIIIE